MRHECETLFDELSDWLDGRPSENVESHLSSCADCRQVVDALRELPCAVPEAPPLPPDFVVAVTRRAQQQVPLLKRLLPRFRHPLTKLLDTRARRLGVRPPGFWIALALGVYGLPALLLALIGLDLSARFFVIVAGIGLMAALPAYYLRTDVALLQSLVKGRCLDELLTSGLSAAGIADALAAYSLRSLARVGLPVAAVLVLGANVFSEEQRSFAFTAAAAWLPVTAAVFVVASYLTQAVLVAPRAVLGVAVGVLAATALAAATHPVTAVVAGVLLALGARAFTIATLRQSRSPQPRSARRNPWIQRASDNPIVHREMARLAGALPAGLAGLFLARLVVPFLVLVPAGFLLDDVGPEWWRPAVWTFLLAVAWLAFLRTALRTSSALAEERERGTLESLLSTRLSDGQFISGWLRVACLPVYLEIAIVLGMLAVLASVLPQAYLEAALVLDLGPATGALAAIALLVMPWAGAWEGLAVSAQTETRREAGARTLAAVARVAWLWLLGWGSLTLAVGFFAVLFGAELRGREWSAILGPVSIVATLGLVALATVASARKVVGVELAWRWGETATASPKSSPRLVLFPAVATVLLAALQAGGLVGLVTLESLRDWRLALPLALAVVVLVLTLATVLFRPAARALVDRTAGSLPATLGLGAGFGALLGLLFSATPLATLALVRAQLVSPSAPGVATLAWFIAFGLALGAAFGAVGFVLRGDPRPPVPLSPLLPRARAGVALVVGGVLLLRWFVLDLPQAPREQVQEIYRRAWEREQARLTVSPGQNGFEQVATAFMRIEEGGPGARAVQLNDGLRALSWAVTGGREDILATLAEEPQRVLDSAREFDAALPRLTRAMERPTWVFPPRWSEGMEGLVPNFILMRALSQSLWVRALMFEQEGRYDEAFDACLLNLDWADQMAGQGPLIHGMIVTAMEAIAGDALLDLLQRHRFAPEQYRRLLTELDRQAWTLQAYLDHLDDELAFGIRAFAEVSASPSDFGLTDQPLASTLALPAIYKERELWLYCTHFVRWRDQANHYPSYDRLAQDIEEELGHTSLAYYLMPNLTRANQQVHLSLTRLEALRTVARLELYRAEHGAYPVALKDLPGELPLDRVSQGREFTYHRAGGGFVLESHGPVLRAVQGGEDTRRWI